MGSRKNQPIFNEEGLCIIKGFQGRSLRLSKKTWEAHILKDRGRWHLKGQFDKIVETLQKQDYILQSPSEKPVVAYTKLFDNLSILDTVTMAAYLYVVVNLNTNVIRTVYDSPKLKKWKQKWQKK